MAAGAHVQYVDRDRRCKCNWSCAMMCNIPSNRKTFVQHVSRGHTQISKQSCCNDGSPAMLSRVLSAASLLMCWWYRSNKCTKLLREQHLYLKLLVHAHELEGHWMRRPSTWSIRTFQWVRGFWAIMEAASCLRWLDNSVGGFF